MIQLFINLIKDICKSFADIELRKVKGSSFEQINNYTFIIQETKLLLIDHIYIYIFILKMMF
jgi:hypothetical protein